MTSIDLRALRLVAAIAGDENRDYKMSLGEIRGQIAGYGAVVAELEANLEAYKKTGDTSRLTQTELRGLGFSWDEVDHDWNAAAAEKAIAACHRILTALRQGEAWSVANGGADVEYFADKIPNLSETGHMYAVMADAFGNNDGRLTADEFESFVGHQKAKATIDDQEAISEVRKALARPRVTGVTTGGRNS